MSTPTKKFILKIIGACLLNVIFFGGLIWIVGSYDDTTGSSNNTPADIHQKLLPQIAQELIDHHDSSRVTGLTPEIKALLEKHSAEDVTFTIGASDLHGETGISFYTKQDHKRFLALGLDLNAKEDGYILSGVSQIDPQ
jgi:hypothetical protein